MSKNWDESVEIVRSDSVATWIRRSIGDDELADAAAEAASTAAVGSDNDDRLVARTCIVLHPSAPIRYRDFRASIDGFGSLLAAFTDVPEAHEMFAAILRNNLIAYWFERQSTPRPDLMGVASQYEKLKPMLERTGVGFGVERAIYELNRNQPCLSPLLYPFGSRGILAIESALPIASEGAEPDILFWLGAFHVRVVAPSTLSGPDMGPAGGSIDGAGVARGFDEGLDEHGRGVVALGPVPGQAVADDGEDVRAEVGDMDPGQDEEPRIVDHQRQVLLAQLRRPSDELVARGELPRGGGEAEHGERPAVAVVDGVAHLGADQGLVAEVMVAGDELIPQLPFPDAAHDGVEVERADLVEGSRCREQRRFGVRSVDDWLRPALPPSGRWQCDQAVAVHGKHGDPGHHVLEPAVGLDPADAPAELLGQGMAAEPPGTGDQGAQQRHLLGGEVAPVIAALDLAGHPGAVSSRLRSSLIDHGSQGDRSSGGLPPFFAHAVSHSSSQRRTSMPLIASVPATEYIMAVNFAPLSLSEPNESRRPMTALLRASSARLLSGGTCGRSTKTLSPTRWLTSERRGLALSALSDRPASSVSASTNRLSTAFFSAPCAASNSGVWRSRPGS